MEAKPHDPYEACEKGQCNHDLARAVAIDELWGSDGPYPPSYLVVSLSTARADLYDDDEEPIAQQRWAV